MGAGAWGSNGHGENQKLPVTCPALRECPQPFLVLAELIALRTRHAQVPRAQGFFCPGNSPIDNKKPRQAQRLPGIPTVCIAGGDATHTQCLKCTQKVYGVKLLCAAAAATAARFLSSSAALSSSHAAIAWSACSSWALIVDSARCMRAAVPLMPKSRR